MLICFDLVSGTGCGATNADTAQVCHQCGASLGANVMRLCNPGDVLRQYQIAGVIGHGGYGAVYIAHDTYNHNRPVALKETLNPQNIRSFEREYKLLHAQQHYGLPAYYEMFEEDGKGYLVMEYVEGKNLQDVLRENNAPLAEADIVHYGEQICMTLEYLHANGLLHRDIKPANIRCTSRGQIKLVDFGLARHISINTVSSQRALTFWYAPIEQYSGGTEPRSDLYALGATLYELLSDTKPKPAPDRVASTGDTLPPLHQINPNVSDTIADVIAMAMACQKEDRFPDATTMKQALLRVSPPPPSLPPQPTEPLVLKEHTDRVRSIAFSPDGQILASSADDRTVRLWDSFTGKQQAILRGHTHEVRSVAFSPDGLLVASGSCDKTVRLWNVTNQMQRAVLTGHTDRVFAVAFSPDGRLLASGGDDNVVHVWDVASGTLLTVLMGHTKDVRSVAFSPDGQTLASASDDKTVWLWDVASSTRRTVLSGQSSRLRTVAFSPNSLMVAMGSLDDKVRIWNTATNRQEAVLWGHKHRVLSIAFSPNGQTLASASRDGNVILWDVASRTQRAVLTKHARKEIRCVTFSPDGQRLASASLDKTIWIGPIP